MLIEGTIYLVNLTTGNISTEILPNDIYRKYPGGSILANYLLLKYSPKGADPLGPDNVLVIATSPLTGLAIPGLSRASVAARSPLTGAVGDSQAGGFFPAQMKAAGADAFVFLGKAPEPVYFMLNEGKAELRPAGHLWGGKSSLEVISTIKKEAADEKVQIALIGKAGENQVRFASIMNMANRAYGRTGMGAVMGSKNLKAIAVRGTKKANVALPKNFKKFTKSFQEQVINNNFLSGLGQFGTCSNIEAHEQQGILPTHNFNSGTFGQEKAHAIGGSTINTTFLKERDTCYACAVRCKRVIELDEPSYQINPEYGGPEYESLAALGSYCGISDIRALLKANELCNNYGMDTISSGATVAWAMEAAEKGLLDDGGLGLRFGNEKAMLTALEMIASRHGIGKLLAEGSYLAAKSISEDALDLTVTVKGAEIPAHMPQSKRSLALIYAVNSFGPDHQSSDHDGSLYSPPGFYIRDRLIQLGLDFNLEATDLSPDKVRFAYVTQVFIGINDSLGLCQFVWGPSWQPGGPNEIVELVQSATGWDVTLEELMKVGERRLNLMRAINAREGIGRDADQLPKKLFKPLEGGLTNGLSIPPEQIEQAKELYYQIAGFDPSTGFPTKGKLVELGLEWVSY